MTDKTKTETLQSYLPLYLGQTTVIRNHGGIIEKGILVGVTKSEVEPDKTISIIDVGADNFLEWYVEETIPVLRPLSSMTEEEAKVVTEIATRFSGRTEWRMDKVIPMGQSVIIQAYHKTVSEKFGTQEYVENIHLSDGIWVNDFHRELQHHTNGFELTQHLLSKGFDIFNLHSKGLCLYTLKEYEKHQS